MRLVYCCTYFFGTSEISLHFVKYFSVLDCIVLYITKIEKNAGQVVQRNTANLLSERGEAIGR